MINVIVASTEKELQDVYTVRREVFIREQQVPESIEMDEKEKESVHFAVYKENDPVGAGRLRIVNQKGKAERVCVLADFRKEGLGLRIMNEMEYVAAEKGAETMQLNAQVSAVPFYQRIGYEVVSEMFYDAGIEHVQMEKSL